MSTESVNLHRFDDFFFLHTGAYENHVVKNSFLFPYPVDSPINVRLKEKWRSSFMYFVLVPFFSGVFFNFMEINF